MKKIITISIFLLFIFSIFAQTDLEKEFKTSFSYYKKRLAQKASRNELLDILNRIKTKYEGTSIDLTEVNKEWERLKETKQNPITNNVDEKINKTETVISDVTSDLEMLRRESAIAEEIKNQIEEVLSQYFKRTTFLVRVQIKLERIKTKGNQMEEMIEMPGLPAKQPKKEKESYDWERIFRIKWMRIELLLQQNTFTPEEKSFIINAIKLKSGFEETRGDKLSIREIPFPQLIEAKTTQSTSTTLLTPLQHKSDSNNWWEHVNIIWFGIGLITGLFLFSIFRTVRRERASPISPPGTISPLQPISYTPIEKTNATKLKEEIKQLIVTTLVGNPELSAKILTRWITIDKENGINQVATLLKATDPKLIKILSDEFDSELIEQIEIATAQLPYPEQEKIDAIFTKFREEYQREQQLESLRYKGKEKDLFLFLKKLKLHQIIQIFEDEEPGVIAVGLAQLPSSLAAKVIKELPPEKRYKIPVEMGKLKKIPASAYYDIAERLSRKALGVSEIEYVSTDGTESLLGILEESDRTTEEDILKSIQQQDLSLMEEIKKVYLTFDDLINLSDKFLSEFLRTIDRDVLAKSIVNAKEEIKNKILNNLPERLKIMVSETSSTYENLPQSEIDQAQRVIVRELRNLLKTGKVDIKNIIEG